MKNKISIDKVITKELILISPNGARLSFTLIGDSEKIDDRIDNIDGWEDFDNKQSCIKLQLCLL